MGQTSSAVINKVKSLYSGKGAGETESANLGDSCPAKRQFYPYVHQRESHQYKDADGDVAHEFYVQQIVCYKTKNGNKRKRKIVMVRVPEEELTPIGYEKLSHPALSVDHPLVLSIAPEFLLDSWR